jgi:pre-mRNA-splicing factor SYF1
VFRRWLQLNPEDAEEFVDYLISIGRLDDAAMQLAKIVNNQGRDSPIFKNNS